MKEKDDFMPPSIYDAVETDETPWFVPDEMTADTLPWQTEPQGSIFKIKDWQDAEAELRHELSQAVFSFGRLSESLTTAPDGLIKRLAFGEVSNLIWSSGHRVERTELALYSELRLNSDDAAPLRHAYWAMRRLTGPLDPLVELSEFLLEDQEMSLHEDRREAAQSWMEKLSQASLLHAFTRACFGYYYWRSLQLDHMAPSIEPAIIAEKIGAKFEGAAPFVPLSFGDRYALRSGGSVKERLSSWYQAIHSACLQSLMEIKRIKEWRSHANHVAMTWSGRTIPLILDLFEREMLVTSQMAAQYCKAELSTALRNFERFEGAGLITEVTGQGRFRYWRANA